MEQLRKFIYGLNPLIPASIGGILTVAQLILAISVSEDVSPVFWYAGWIAWIGSAIHLSKWIPSFALPCNILGES